MGSINAQRVAHKVIAKVRNNELVNMGEIVVETGYSPKIKRHPSSVTNTKSYKTALAMEMKPLIDRLDNEIDRITFALSQKNYSKEEVRTLAGTLDIMLRNKNVLNGGVNTLNVFVLPSEVMEKNVIKTVKPDTLESTSETVDNTTGDE